ELPEDDVGTGEITEPLALLEPAGQALLAEIEQRRLVIEDAVASGDGFRRAFQEASRFKPAVDRFFDDVLVMADDPRARRARLQLLRKLERLILKLANISEVVREDR